MKTKCRSVQNRQGILLFAVTMGLTIFGSMGVWGGVKPGTASDAEHSGIKGNKTAQYASSKESWDCGKVESETEESRNDAAVLPGSEARVSLRSGALSDRAAEAGNGRKIEYISRITLKTKSGSNIRMPAVDHMPVGIYEYEVSEVFPVGPCDQVQFTDAEGSKLLQKQGTGYVPYNGRYYQPGIYCFRYYLKVGKGGETKYVPEEDMKVCFTYMDMEQGEEDPAQEEEYWEFNPHPVKEDGDAVYYEIRTPSFEVTKRIPLTRLVLSGVPRLTEIYEGDTLPYFELRVEEANTREGAVGTGSTAEALQVRYSEWKPNVMDHNLNLQELRPGQRLSLPKGRYDLFLTIRLAGSTYRFSELGTDDGRKTEIEFRGTKLEQDHETRVERDLRGERYLSFRTSFEVKEKKSGSQQPDPGNKTEQPGSGGDSGSGSTGGSGSIGGSGSTGGGGRSGGGAGGGGGSRTSAAARNTASGTASEAQALGGGMWMQNQTGWWYARADGSYPKAQWGYELYNGSYSWYYFNNTGYMATGWIDQLGQRYYLNPVSDGWKGRMLTGWQWIDGACYYFETSGTKEGRLLRDGATPDGYEVNREGRWILNGVVQKPR